MPPTIERSQPYADLLRRRFAAKDCRAPSVATMARRLVRPAPAAWRDCRRGGSSSASSRTSSIRPPPQENGRHERMAIAPSRPRPRARRPRTRPRQQERFDTFRRRATSSGRMRHSANDRRTRSTRHRSGRCRSRIGEPWYDADHQVRRVRQFGRDLVERRARLRHRGADRRTGRHRRTRNRRSCGAILPSRHRLDRLATADFAALPRPFRPVRSRYRFVRWHRHIRRAAEHSLDRSDRQVFEREVSVGDDFVAAAR